MTPIDLNSHLTAARTLAPVSRTASANGTSLDLRQYNGNVLALVDCGAATAGTNPTAAFTLEDSADDSSFAANTAALSSAFSQVTTVASLQQRGIDTRRCRRYIRLVFTIGGTDNPAFPASAHLIGQKQVVA